MPGRASTLLKARRWPTSCSRLPTAARPGASAPSPCPREPNAPPDWHALKLPTPDGILGPVFRQPQRTPLGSSCSIRLRESDANTHGAPTLPNSPWAPWAPSPSPLPIRIPTARKKAAFALLQNKSPPITNAITLRPAVAARPAHSPPTGRPLRVQFLHRRRRAAKVVSAPRRPRRQLSRSPAQRGHLICDCSVASNATRLQPSHAARNKKGAHAQERN